MTTVYIVMRKTEVKVSSWSDLMAASREHPAEIVDVYTDELDAARVAGSSPDAWYVTKDVVPGASGDEDGAGEPGTYRLSLIVPEELTPEVLGDALLLAGYRVRPGLHYANLSTIEAMMAYDWAVREHLSASDNDIETRDRPSCLVPAE